MEHWSAPIQNVAFFLHFIRVSQTGLNGKLGRGQKDKICQICDYFAKEEGCGARRLVEYFPSE